MTPEAVKRLGIATARAERRRVERARLLAGEVEVPPGRSARVRAPVAGRVEAPEGASLPEPGQPVSRGQPLLVLHPLLPPAERIGLAASRAEAEGKAERATAELEAARIAHARTERLLQERSSSERAREEAKARLETAQADLKAARGTLQALASGPGEAFGAPLELTAPLGGILFSLEAVPGELAAAGEILFEVADLDRLWVRVPVYAGDLADIDPAATALVQTLGARAPASACRARPVPAPPRARPEAAAVDLVYELEGKRPPYRPGERVEVLVPRASAGEELTVPLAALVHDPQGRTWVYEELAPGAFARRLVKAGETVGGVAVLLEGPAPGTPLVVVGAAELWGSELGSAK